MMANVSAPCVLVALFVFLLVATGRGANSAKSADEEERILLEKYEKILDAEQDSMEAAEQEAKSKGVHDLLGLLEEFSQLNKELETRLPQSQDIGQNVALAKSLADVKLSRSVRCLELLASLASSSSQDERMCGSYSETALRLATYLAGGLEKSARLAAIVRQVSLEHAHRCQPIYAAKYRDQVGQLKPAEKEKLFGVLSDYLVAGFLLDNPSSLVDLMHSYGSQASGVDSSWQPKLARRLFQTLAAKTADNKKLNFVVQKANRRATLDERKFSSAYSQLLKQPCELFVRQLETEVFAPASFDLGVSNAPLLKQQLGQDEIEFAFGFFRFEFCKMLLADQRDSFAKELKRAINN